MLTHGHRGEIRCPPTVILVIYFAILAGSPGCACRGAHISLSQNGVVSFVLSLCSKIGSAPPKLASFLRVPF